jgi:two-component system LytT family sensor kinase
MNDKGSWYEWKWIQVGLHITFWLGLMFLPHLMMVQAPKNADSGTHDVSAGAWPTVVDLIAYGYFIAIFYLNAYVLTPRLLYSRQYWYYLLSVLGLFAIKIAVFYPLLHLVHTVNTYDVGFLTYAVGNFFVMLFFLALSTSYRTIRDKIQSDRLAKDQRQEHLRAELTFLRSQISPHFMFNVLNNIVALVRMKSDKLEPTIFKLSSLMRYMLYQADDQKISLQKEADYLQSYIDLQQLRVGEKVRLHVSIKPGQEPFSIEPMLLIPFIENAFKHGTGYMEHPQIDIHLSVTDGLLYFTARNRFNPGEETKDATSGIGLANVKRRLNLLYGEEYDLWVTTRNNWFLVSLQLNLNYVAMHRSR